MADGGYVATCISTWTLLLLHVCLHFVSLRAEILRLPLHTSGQWVSDEVRAKVTGSSREVYRGAAPQDNLGGKPGLGFYVEIELGTPKQKLNVLLDTGSSNFAVAASANNLITRYFHKDRSSTYHDLKKKVYVPYTQGEWRGELGQDLASIPTSHPNISVLVNVASITYSEEFFINESNWQGILGLAYADIARPDNSVKPFFDSLIEQSDVGDIFTLQLCGFPENRSQSRGQGEDSEVTGTMTIGGIDASLYTGDIWYTAIRADWYYEVIIIDIAVGNQSLNMDCKEYNFDKTIVDSGTTNLRLPTRVFEKLTSLINDSIKMEFYEPVPDMFWTGDQFVCETNAVDPWARFPSLSVVLNATEPDTGFRLIISPKQYLRHVQTEDADAICYKFGVSPSDTGSVIGAVVMEGFYVVFDRENQSVGFAKSSCAHEFEFATPAAGIEGPIRIVASDCGYVAPADNSKVLMIAAYVMAGLCVLCLLPMLFMYTHHQCRKWCGNKRARHDDSELLEDRTDSSETETLREEPPPQAQGGDKG